MYTNSVGKSSARIRSDLRRIHEGKRRFLRLLGQTHELAIGTVSIVQRKCGKAGCHCAEGAGHPQMLFLFNDDTGTRRCKLIRRQDEKRLLRAARRYREVRAALRQLRAIHKREEQILVALVGTRGLTYE